jgi:hypothetical protein
MIDVFDENNWNCATMNALRDIAEKHGYKQRDDDCCIGVVLIPRAAEGAQSGHIVMTWYKERGKTSRAIVMYDDSIQPLLRETAESVVWAYRDMEASDAE